LPWLAIAAAANPAEARTVLSSRNTVVLLIRFTSFLEHADMSALHSHVANVVSQP
jgi:hypothetical protein